MVLVLLGIAGCLIWRVTAINQFDLVVFGNPFDHWWRIFSASFIYDNTGYAFVALTVIAIYGSLTERRHGPVIVVALALIGGAGGLAVAGRASGGLFMGGNGAALALLSSWAVPDLIRLARKQDFDGDLIGTGVLAGVLVLMPIAAPNASWVAAGVGAGAGLILGLLLTRIHHTA
jgi:membrane associated rhomboid family serine protease